MRYRWRDARARLRTRELIAYHEAGHAIVAYEFGWWVRRGGVRISAWAHASLQHHKSDDNLRANICVSMAGLLAEEKFLGQQWRFEEEVIDELRALRVALRAGNAEYVRLYPSDLRAIALALLDDDPTTSLIGARRVVAYLRNETNALLDDPRVWGGIERVAKALLRRRYPVSPRVVRQLLGDAFFVGVQRDDGDANDQLRLKDF